MFGEQSSNSLFSSRLFGDFVGLDTTEVIGRFVDREDELGRLRGCYESDDADMVGIFGRRRLGKTELVRESLDGRDDAVLYQATDTVYCKSVPVDRPPVSAIHR